MELIKLMQKDYRRILLKTMFLTPITEEIGRIYMWIPALILMPIGGPLLIVRGMLGYVSLIDALGAFAWLLGICFFIRPGIIYVYMIGILPKYFRNHKRFVAKVEQLTPAQYEAILSEYPTARKIPIYYDQRKKILGSEAIYVTSNFLFVPGLFLIERDEIENIILYGKEYGVFLPQAIFSFTLKNQSKQNLLIAYRYFICPETAEQVMAWFWGCAPDDPKLWGRTNIWYKECEKQWPPWPASREELKRLFGEDFEA